MFGYGNAFHNKHVINELSDIFQNVWILINTHTLMKFCCYYYFSQYPLKPSDLLGKVKIYLIFPQKRNQGEAIKSVIVETANNVTSSLMDFFNVNDDDHDYSRFIIWKNLWFNKIWKSKEITTHIQSFKILREKYFICSLSFKTQTANNVSRLLDSLLKDYDNSLRPDFWGGLTGYPHENIVQPEMLNFDE